MRATLFCAVLTLAAGVTISACEGADPVRLQEGRWTGGLTPMNHPEMATPLIYTVRYEGDALTLALGGADGTAMPARDVALAADTLRFVFDEPEAGVPLRCALGRRPTGAFEGRCTDAGGKWARFTMTPPGG